MKKRFKIPVAYEMYGYVEVEGDSLEDAIQYAKDNIDLLPLPDDAEYVDNTYQIDEEGIIIEIPEIV